MKKSPGFHANFDSASGMLRALGRFLHGKDNPTIGMGPPMDQLGLFINALPKKVRETIYTWSGWSEAVPSDNLDTISAERLSEWVVREYPEREYPAVMIGSSNGAMVNLGAALGIPWLPQTFLIPVRHHGLHPDDAKEGMEWGIKPGRQLLDANPELQLHHMWDPNQDRLMLHKMTYFRVKRLRLGETYRNFLKQVLPEGSTIFVLDSRRTWPTTRLDDRFIFQFGALGGATPDEFLHGGERVRKYLEMYGSHRRQWDPPEPNGHTPEAEWGFEQKLMEDIEEIALARKYTIRRIVYEEPEHLSPLVADLYRWWYKERRLNPSRLLVESFLLTEPYWALRTGSAPFWIKFNMEPSLEWLSQYLEGADPYDYINLMLFSHGVNCVGLPSIDQWRSVLTRARKKGTFTGVAEDKFPMDFAVFSRYYTDVKKVPARYPIPGPLSISQLDSFLEQAGDRYPVEWAAHRVAAHLKAA
jgi:hypothetical protein